MKTLNDLAVLQAAETLMRQNGQTTTLDVKNLLRQQSYEATQSEVSSRMEIVARQESWHINSAGAYKIYKPAPDTTETLQSYWELASQRLFWEVKAQDKTLQIVEGRIGTDGTVQTLAYPTNRETIREAQRLIQEKKNNGYQSAKDSRLPLAIRQYFGAYFSKTLQSLKLAYFGVLQTHEQDKIKEGGYEYLWNLPAQTAELQDVWTKTIWSPSASTQNQAAVLGEKIIKKDIKLSTDIEVHQEKLFRATLYFTDGSSLQMGRYDAVFAQKNAPRHPSETFWATIQRFLYAN